MEWTTKTVDNLRKSVEREEPVDKRKYYLRIQGELINKSNKKSHELRKNIVVLE